MRYGPILGAGAMFSLACSWAALVMAPQLQLGALAPAPLPNSTEIYPPARPGLAAQGAEVYRSLGCAQCHTRVVRQAQALYGVRLNELGTPANLIPAGADAKPVNPDLLIALATVRPDLTIAPLPVPPAVAGDTNVVARLKQFADNVAQLKRNDVKAGITRPTSGASVNDLAAKLPATIFELVSVEVGERAVKYLTDAGAKAELTFFNLGPDIERGWGARRTVAQDYVNDSPVLLGGVRVGPDLAGIGSRAPEKFAAPWKYASTNTVAELERHLLVHLYNPRLLAKETICPSAGYLFDKQKPEVRFAGEPLIVPGKDAPVFPKHEARALVAYLLTQRADTGVAEAPVATAPKAAAPAAAPKASAKP
jgi:cbb3-type cytochrome oxidase cytochrome c subunit